MPFAGDPSLRSGRRGELQKFYEKNSEIRSSSDVFQLRLAELYNGYAQTICEIYNTPKEDYKDYGILIDDVPELKDDDDSNEELLEFCSQKDYLETMTNFLLDVNDSDDDNDAEQKSDIDPLQVARIQPQLQELINAFRKGLEIAIEDNPSNKFSP